MAETHFAAAETLKARVPRTSSLTRQPHPLRTPLSSRFARLLLAPLFLCLAPMFVFLATVPLHAQADRSSWQGTLLTKAREPVGGATIRLSSGADKATVKTAPDGTFRFPFLPSGSYTLSANLPGRAAVDATPLQLPVNAASAQIVILDGNTLTLEQQSSQGVPSGGEQLSGQTVSAIPLNKRDFSQLLLLAAGTMTDSNGATNFTQQFAINGQRGVEAVFAMDGADISDPEMGGATFSNFNVDAVQEIQSSSGWMPADIGRGAAGFTNIVTRSGASGFHGSVFEFIRNSSLDARNFFDKQSPENPGRLPPFRRNEFGFTNGGPVVIPHLYDGRGRTFYFGQYQGFRQVLGTTQVIPVPTAEERAGRDTTAFPGDMLLIPVDPRIAASLSRYPLPNEPQGAFGAHTYATSSKILTIANQFSIRLDHTLSDKAQLFIRFNLDNLTGPTTNPDQTVIDPSFGIKYIDRQRNGVITYTRNVSPRFTIESSLSFTRTTPSFPTTNHTDAALTFGDGLFEPFNNAAGSVMTAYGNLFQARQNFSLIKGKHSFKAGIEARSNRDTTYFGISPNGAYTFGGGTAYSPVNIQSQSGQHNILAGAPLPDTLSGLLTASPFAYTLAVAPSYFSQGDHMGAAAISRDSGGIFFEDSWKISDRFVLNYGLRYEVYSPIRERANRTSGLATITTGNQVQQEYVINPQPGYRLDLNGGWGPRVQLGWRAPKELQVNVGGGITTIPPNIWQDNYLTGSTPFVIYPRITAAPGAPVPFGHQITPSELPHVYTPGGTDIFPNGNTKAVPANTVMDVNRFERDLAALTPDHQITPLNVASISPSFGNAYLATWVLALERHFGGLDANAAYVGTAGVKIPRVNYPNGYPGADAAFAPFTQFGATGQVSGGFGTETVIEAASHSTYHSLQTSLAGNIGRAGPGIQASYTWSRSIDDTSSVNGGFISGGSGAVAQAAPQNPQDVRAEKGPSTFDVAHTFTLSLAQDLHGEAVGFLRPINRKVTAGWELLSISTITSGSPFTIYSGVQQTGVGANGVDRPDQIGVPRLSTSRKTREDYFGLGADNASFFSIPINIAGGTGPNQGRFGTLGRNTFRGPAFYDYDFALIKDTPFGRRGTGELFTAEFRSEFFNLFNIVNFSLPANIIRGSGFGEISRTAGTSRQIQFSLKILF